MSVIHATKCGAQTRTGGRCRQPVITGRNRCRMHGGKTPRGLANPNTRTGLYSRDMPTQMLARFEQAQKDRELLSLRADVALVTAVIGERLAEMEQAGQQVDWDKAIAKLDQLFDQGEAWSWERIQGELRGLGEMLRAKRNEQSIFSEIRSLIDQRARLVAQENRRLEDLKQTLTVEEAIVYAQVLAAIIRRYINDQKTLTAINRDFQQILNRPVIDVESVISVRNDGRD